MCEALQMCGLNWMLIIIEHTLPLSFSLISAGLFILFWQQYVGSRHASTHTHTHTHTPRVSLWSIPQDSILSSAREQSAQMEGWMRDLPPAGFQINKPNRGREYETAGAEMKRSASESSSRQTWRNPRTPTATCARWLHTAGLFICVQCTRPAFEDHCSRAQQHAVSDQSVWQEVVLQAHL